LEKFVGVFEGNGDASASGNQAAENNLPADGPEWIELFVSEMSCATSVDDARARAAKLLEVLEKSISANVSSGAMTDLQRVCVWTVIDFFNGSLIVLLEFCLWKIFMDCKCLACIVVVLISGFFVQENLMLKYQVEVLTKERNCFKSAFRIQLERLSDYEDKDRELQQLKQLVSQYQEQIRTLEVRDHLYLCSVHTVTHLIKTFQSFPYSSLKISEIQLLPIFLHML
jgi:hypothetical protein